MAAIEMILKDQENYKFLADGDQTEFQTAKVWADNKATDEDALDEQGRKTWFVNVLVRKNGEKIDDVTRLAVHTQPKPLKDLQPVKPVGPVEVSKWGKSRMGSTFVESRYGFSVEALAE